MTGWAQSFHSLSFLRANVVVDVINGCKQRAQSSLHNAMSYLFLRVHCELQPRCLLRCILNAFLQITKDNCRKSIRPSLYDHGSRLIGPDLKDSSEVTECWERILVASITFTLLQFPDGHKKSFCGPGKSSLQQI